jgi:Holliday junction DNA helicase RuvA
MIAFLHGKLMEATPARAVIDAGGVGYEVLVPLSTYSKIAEHKNGNVRLLIHHHFSGQDGSQRLYGFFTEQERETFRMLLDVSGIGPKMALNVLNGISTAAFRGVVASGDTATLSKIRGVGKKTAERIIVELKDKIGAAGEWEAASEKRAPTPEEQLAHDAILALISLGFKQNDARAAVEKARAHLGAKANVEELVRRALQGG